MYHLPNIIKMSHNSISGAQRFAQVPEGVPNQTFAVQFWVHPRLFIERHPRNEQSLQQSNCPHHREEILLRRCRQEIQSLLCRELEEQSSEDPKQVADLRSAQQKPRRRLQAARSIATERAKSEHQHRHGSPGREIAERPAGTHPTAAHGVPEGTQAVLDTVWRPSKFSCTVHGFIWDSFQY